MGTLTEVRGQHALVERTPERQAGQKRLPQHSVSNVLIPISMAIDLAEGRTPGHAQRVAYIAMTHCRMRRPGPGRTAVGRATPALLHDIGVIAAGSEISGATGRDERLIFAALPSAAARGSAVGLWRLHRHLRRARGRSRRPRRPCGPTARAAERRRASDPHPPRAVGRRWLSGGPHRPGDADPRPHRQHRRPRRSPDRPGIAAAGAPQLRLLDGQHFRLRRRPGDCHRR